MKSWLNKKKGLFVTFEGGEGTGKTTQIRILEERLKKKYQNLREVLVSWEPGSTPLGEKLRSVLLDPENKPFSSRAEALIYAAARAQHVETVLRPALEKGSLVLCDRYWEASLAYQGWARALGFRAIQEVNEWATEGLRADRVFLFDLNPRQGLERVAQRSLGILDRLEQETLSFHERIREAYLELARRDPTRIVVLDASLEKDLLAEKIWEQLTPFLPS